VTGTNLPPVLDSIRARTVPEGGTLSFTVTASDPDLDPLTLTAAPLPANASFVDNGDGTGDFLFTPDFTQAGLYDITFAASDGVLADSEAVSVTVTDVNRAPILDPIGPKVTNVGDTLRFLVTAQDPDADSIILSADPLPANAAFVDSGNGRGSFEFIPDATQAGLHEVTFVATDDGVPALADSELVSITVSPAGNRPPLFKSPEEVTAVVGRASEFIIVAEDADQTIPVLCARDLPPNASFVDRGDGTGTLQFTPDGTEPYKSVQAVITASDGYLADTLVLSVEIVLPTGPVVIDPQGPLSFSLTQNAPNPFNSITYIRYSIPMSCEVRLEIFNQAGQSVKILVEGNQNAGYHVVKWSGKDELDMRVPSGIYFCRIVAGDWTSAKKMVLVD